MCIRDSRTVKENDVNRDKWIGVGGHFEKNESPEECLLREVKEETGYTLTSWQYRGIVTFVYGEDTIEYMSLFTADGFEGTQISCDEGELEWVEKAAIDVYKRQLYHWELGNFVLAFEGMFLLLLLCSAGISWSGVSAEWKHTKLFVEEGEALQSQIFVRNRLCIPVCKLRIDLSYQYAGEEKKRKEKMCIRDRVIIVCWNL